MAILCATQERRNLQCRRLCGLRIIIKTFPHRYNSVSSRRRISPEKNNPHFKDKIQIAMELFDNARKSLDFSAVTFDSWYAATKFLEHIHSQGKFFFSEMKSNRNIFTLLDTVWAYLLEQAQLSYLTG